MNIEGLPSCYDKTGGLFYFPRMCAKIRLHAAGRLPEDYHELLGKGFDGRTSRYLEVSYEDVKAQVLAGKSDEDVLEWCQSTGRRLNEEQILFFNCFMSKRGWRDDETEEFVPDLVKRYGLPQDGSIVTDFDVIEADEGRWRPEQWKDGWR